MSSMKPKKMTVKGVKLLEEELEYLKGPKRREMAERIEVARSFGDLSENSEYEDAKNEQSHVEGRILEIEAILRNVEIISEEDFPSDVVGMYSYVKVYDQEFDEEITYKMVGSEETGDNNISMESPVGAALMGKKVGETVEVITPGGKVIFKILEITR
ncbi:MAG: transcription elongation factor GreA [Clostridia bacterium]|nr:transcription elongation factor GreA [Clostridia bacterium]